MPDRPFCSECHDRQAIKRGCCNACYNRLLKAGAILPTRPRARGQATPKAWARAQVPVRRAMSWPEEEVRRWELAVADAVTLGLTHLIPRRREELARAVARLEGSVGAEERIGSAREGPGQPRQGGDEGHAPTLLPVPQGGCGHPGCL